MREEGSKNHKFTTPEGYTFDGIEGNLFHISRRNKAEAMEQFKQIITPIINEHLRNISDQRLKSLKKQYFKEVFSKLLTN